MRKLTWEELAKENKELKEHNKQVHFKLEGEKKVSQLLREKSKSDDEEKTRLHECIDAYAKEAKKKPYCKDRHEHISRNIGQA